MTKPQLQEGRRDGREGGGLGGRAKPGRVLLPVSELPVEKNKSLFKIIW